MFQNQFYSLPIQKKCMTLMFSVFIFTSSSAFEFSTHALNASESSIIRHLIKRLHLQMYNKSQISNFPSVKYDCWKDALPLRYQVDLPSMFCIGVGFKIGNDELVLVGVSSPPAVEAPATASSSPRTSPARFYRSILTLLRLMVHSTPDQS